MLTEKSIPLITIPPDKVRVRVKDEKQPGLFLTVGRQTKTWELKRRGTWHRVGSWPSLSCAAARQRALEILASLDTGRPVGLTLDRAYDMWKRQKARSPLTLRGAEDLMRLHFSAWRTRPLEKLSRQEVQRRHEQITASAGPAAANNAMRLFRSLWNQAMRLDPGLPVAPTIAVIWNQQPTKDESHLYENLQDWWSRLDDVVTNPMRIALYRFALLTGLRANDVRTMRWENVRGDTLHLPTPKGGPTRAFQIPLVTAHSDLLDEARRVAARPGCPWVWPANSESGHVTDLTLSIAESRSFADLPWSMHSLRRVFISAAVEVGLSHYEIGLLVNHNLPGVTGSYVAKRLDLRGAMQKVVDRLRPSP